MNKVSAQFNPFARVQASQTVGQGSGSAPIARFSAQQAGPGFKLPDHAAQLKPHAPVIGREGMSAPTFGGGHSQAGTRLCLSV